MVFLISYNNYLNLAVSITLLIALDPNYPINPPTRPPINAPSTGIGIKLCPTVAPIKPEPIEVADPRVIFLN